MYTNLLVYIVRHGETNENRLGIIQGQMDTQLNDAGRAQAKLTGKALKDVNFVKAYTSDSTRAADTARAIVAYHPRCELVLDARIRERNMGSLSGTKAPARRPLPPSVETKQSVSLRLNNFWDNTILPLLLPSSHTTSSDQTGGVLSSDPSSDADSRVNGTPAVLIVSHGATISKLIHDVLLYENGYTTTCDLSRRGIYNTSISIVRLDAISQDATALEGKGNGEDEHAAVSVSGELLSFASIAHLIRKKDIVKENADMLGEGTS